MKDEEREWFDHPQFATQLEARVVDESGNEPRIHGFGVCSDLARSFSVADVLLIALTGKEPSTQVSEAIRRTLIVLAPLRTGSTPTHLGILAHLVSRDFASSVASAAAALAERAAMVVRERGDLLDSLRRGEQPSGALLRTLGGTASAQTSADVFDGCSDVTQQPWFAQLDLTSAALVVLFDCGLKESWQLESAVFWAWSPCVLAEIGSRGKDPLESYPIHLPRFRYVVD